MDCACLVVSVRATRPFFWWLTYTEALHDEAHDSWIVGATGLLGLTGLAESVHVYRGEGVPSQAWEELDGGLHQRDRSESGWKTW